MTRPKCAAIAPAPDSPTTKKYKLVAECSIFKQSFDKLLTRRGANSGKRQHGDIANIAKGFEEKGFKYVTTQNICHCLKVLKDIRSLLLPTEIAKPATAATIAPTTLSPLTDDGVIPQAHADKDNLSSGSPTTQNNINTNINIGETTTSKSTSKKGKKRNHTSFT
jgi:hypothetical protein